MKNYLQQEWAFVQRVTPYIWMDFQVVEDVLRDIFLPALFQGGTAQIPGREITGLPVLCDHQALRRGNPRDGQVQVSKSFLLDGVG